MTSKETLDKQKVRAVWPNAYVDWFMSSHEYVIWSTDDPSEKILGRGPKKYAAWQNAAESLPAQPEQPKCYGFIGKPLDSECFYGYHNQCRGCNCKCHPDAAKYEPVAPVEAKENPTCICEHSKNLHWPESKDQYKLSRCFYLGCDCQRFVAEPKPTPSTLAGNYYTLDDAKNRLFEAIDAWPTSINQYQRIILDVHSMLIELKSQPDSSSIPEQTFEQWWNSHGRLFLAGDDVHVQRCVMNISERAWGAAKGQSNGR